MPRSFTGGQEPPNRKREPFNCPSIQTVALLKRIENRLSKSDWMRLEPGHNLNSHPPHFYFPLFHYISKYLTEGERGAGQFQPGAEDRRQPGQGDTD